jgi:hypothetical protein
LTRQRVAVGGVAVTVAGRTDRTQWTLLTAEVPEGAILTRVSVVSFWTSEIEVKFFIFIYVSKLFQGMAKSPIDWG